MTTIRVPSPPSQLPAGWEDLIFKEMERRFNLRSDDDDNMRNDDTQIGVEFAIEHIKRLMT